MDAHKLQVKLFTTDDARAIDLAAFIPVFHEWVKHRRLPELLIDVANYAHVPKGPGVALIGHGLDCFIDDTDGRRGLLVSRKRAVGVSEGANQETHLDDIFRHALLAATLLEAEPSLGGKVRFRTDEILVRVNDRLAAPRNDDAGLAALQPALLAFARRLYKTDSARVTRAGSPKSLLSATLTTDAKAGATESVETLLDRVGGAPRPVALAAP